MPRSLLDSLFALREQFPDLNIADAMMQRGFGSLIIPTDDYVQMMRIFDGVKDAKGNQFGMIDYAANRSYPYLNPEIKELKPAFARRFMQEATLPSGAKGRELKPEVKAVLRDHANAFLEMLYHNHQLRQQLDDVKKHTPHANRVLADYNQALTTDATNNLLSDLESGKALGKMSRDDAIMLARMTIGACLATFSAYLEGKRNGRPVLGPVKPDLSLVIEPQFMIEGPKITAGGSDYTKKMVTANASTLAATLGNSR